MSAEAEVEQARLRARQREVWRLIRATLPVDFSVSIESGRAANSLGEARVGLSFTCVFDVGVRATDAQIQAMAEIARDRLIEGIKAWPSEPLV